MATPQSLCGIAIAKNIPKRRYFHDKGFQKHENGNHNYPQRCCYLASVPVVPVPCNDFFSYTDIEAELY